MSGQARMFEALSAALNAFTELDEAGVAFENASNSYHAANHRYNEARRKATEAEQNLSQAVKEAAGERAS